ncbi:putative ribonuclease H-like domain-containing protein [Tanacetum coccineum]
MVINSPCLTDKKELAIPGQTTTGKEFSNPLMAGSLPKTISAKVAVPGAKKPWGALVKTRYERVLEKPNEPPLPEGHTSKSGEGSKEHTFELMDTVPPTPHDLPLTGGYIPGSDEGRLKLKELMAICIKFSKQVIDLEKEKDAQAVESSDDDLDEEDASKHGRESDKTKSMFQDSDFDVIDDDMEYVEGETIHTATTGVSVVSAPVTTAGVAISTAEPRTPPTTAATAFIDEDLTIAQTLIKMKEEKAKEKGVAIKDVEDSPRPIRSITTLQPLPTINPKDKGKGVLVEEEPEKPEKVKRRDQGLLEKYFERRKKQLAAERAEAIRNKPPIRAQKLYQKEQKWINEFKPMDSEEDGSNTKKAGKRIKRIADSTSKQKSPKKSKVIKEQESTCWEIDCKRLYTGSITVKSGSTKYVWSYKVTTAKCSELMLLVQSYKPQLKRINTAVKKDKDCLKISPNPEVSTDSNCSSSCLENFKILKEQNEQLLKDLRTSKINAITYKTGLKKSVKQEHLRRKLELTQKQKDEIQLTVEKLENSSKSLSKLIDCQIVDKCKTGLGYNAVPPPYTGNFMPLKPDLSFSGLEEFVNEPIVSEPTVKKHVVETSEAKASADKPKAVRKNNGAPIIEDWVSDSEEEDVPQAKKEKKTVKSSFAKIEFVKSKEQVKSPRKITVKQGTKACDDAGKARMETVPGKDYILLPLWTADPPFSQSLKNSQDDGSEPSSDDEKKVDEDPRKDSESIDQEKDDNVNSTNNVNAASTNEVNDVGGKTSIELLDDPNMPALEDYSIFDLSSDDQDNGAKANMNDLDTTIQVSPIPTTRIYKDHPLNQVIGDLQSATQTRNMSKNLEEYGFVKEPKKVIHALKYPSWIEAMQEELLQFKLQEVWTLVDLPIGKRAIGTKWVFKNKKDERGIVIRNKARLVAQGYTQEEEIDYDEVFSLVNDWFIDVSHPQTGPGQRRVPMRNLLSISSIKHKEYELKGSSCQEIDSSMIVSEASVSKSYLGNSNRGKSHERELRTISWVLGYFENRNRLLLQMPWTSRVRYSRQAVSDSSPTSPQQMGVIDTLRLIHRLKWSSLMLATNITSSSPDTSLSDPGWMEYFDLCDSLHNQALNITKTWESIRLFKHKFPSARGSNSLAACFFPFDRHKATMFAFLDDIGFTSLSRPQFNQRLYLIFASYGRDCACNSFDQ